MSSIIAPRVHVATRALLTRLCVLEPDTNGLLDNGCHQETPAWRVLAGVSTQTQIASGSSDPFTDSTSLKGAEGGYVSEEPRDETQSHSRLHKRLSEHQKRRHQRCSKKHIPAPSNRLFGDPNRWFLDTCCHQETLVGGCWYIFLSPFVLF